MKHQRFDVFWEQEFNLLVHFAVEQVLLLLLFLGLVSPGWFKVAVSGRTALNQQREGVPSSARMDESKHGHAPDPQRKSILGNGGNRERNVKTITTCNIYCIFVYIIYIISKKYY